jgi:uncharacterized protein YciI
MKNTILVIALFSISIILGQTITKKDSINTNPNYDKELAEKLGADKYGMKSYFLVILKTGKNTTNDKELIANSFKGHMENMTKLVADKKLIIAGPMGKNDQNYRGIFILSNLKTIEEAKELLQTDLAIKNGLLDFEIFNWYGSAALAEYLPFSDKIWKVNP